MLTEIRMTLHRTKGLSKNNLDISHPIFEPSLNLETAVVRKKDAYGIGVHGEIKKFVVTLWVMRHFFIVPGAQELAWTFVIQLRFLH